MKKRILFFLFFIIMLLSEFRLFAQVGINNDGGQPHPSAGLDVNFNNKGFLPPRMTHAELNAISSPANGLIVYCTDCGINGAGAVAMATNGAWYILNATCLNPFSPASGVHVPSLTQIVWNWNTVPNAIGYMWNTVNDYASAINMGTATAKTETGLICNTLYNRYVWALTNCGVSAATTLAQLTTLTPPAEPTVGNLLPSPTQVIWNWNIVTNATGYKWNTTNNYGTAMDLGSSTTKMETGLACNTSYTRFVWAYHACGNSTALTMNQTTSLNPPEMPATGAHIPLSGQIIWNWNTVPNATGYKWNTINDYGSAMDMGTATTKTESGLTCNTSYTRYVWAYSSCGNSLSLIMNQTTSLNPPASPTVGAIARSYNQIIWNWNPVSGATGYKWSTTNDYNTAIDMGTATTKTETGLTCNTPYTRYAWAYSSCGNSLSLTMNQTTSLNPPASPTAGTHVPTTTQIIWNWATVSGATGYKWNTTNNYGTATDVGTSITKTETGLACNTAYTRYVWAYGTCGSSTALTMNQITSGCSQSCGQAIIDSRDGKTYNTVLVGMQCWMAQNLDIGTRIDGHVEQTNNSIIEKYCYLNNDANCAIYGGLYTWNELMNYSTSSNTNPSSRQGVCPLGWHLPSEAEWCQLETFLDLTVNCTIAGAQGTDVGGKLKETGISHWANPNTGATNSSGFTALPGGYSGALNEGFYSLQYSSYFWSTTENSSSDAWERLLGNTDPKIYRNSSNKLYGISARCLKD